MLSKAGLVSSISLQHLGLSAINDGHEDGEMATLHYRVGRHQHSTLADVKRARLGQLK